MKYKELIYIREQFQALVDFKDAPSRNITVNLTNEIRNYKEILKTLDNDLDGIRLELICMSNNPGEEVLWFLDWRATLWFMKLSLLGLWSKKDSTGERVIRGKYRNDIVVGLREDINNIILPDSDPDVGLGFVLSGNKLIRFNVRRSL